MKRVADYVRFALWLVGIGYIVLWPLTSFAHGLPFAAPFFCTYLQLAFLCHLPHPLTLSPGLQLIGFASAVYVCLWLVLRGLARAWRGHLQRVTAAPGARIPAAVMRPRRSKPVVPLRPVKPRRQFGLRNTPR
jgi:hypothetical protein